MSHENFARRGWIIVVFGVITGPALFIGGVVAAFLPWNEQDGVTLFSRPAAVVVSILVALAGAFITALGWSKYEVRSPRRR